MRLLIIVLTLVLFVGVLGFVMTNVGTQVPIRFWTTPYPAVPLYLVVILSVFAGILYAGIIAVAEGAHIRLANRRLSREIRKLETELNYVRTQPAAPARPEPDEISATPSPKELPVSKPSGARSPASAPIYGTDEEDWPSDDDTYSGGRAV